MGHLELWSVLKFFPILFFFLYSINFQRLVRDKTTKTFHAMKILIKQMIVKQKQVDHALNEKRILSAIDFPFVVSMEFSYKDNDCLYFGMPFISGGEMFTSLRR